jgi:sugar diacid utilization regulator
VAGTEDLGALVLQTDAPLVDADLRILERAALVTALLQLFARNVADAEGRVRGDLLDDLLVRPVRHEAALRARASRLGVDLDSANVLVAVATEDGPARQRAFSWATTYASTRGGLAGVRPNRVLLLVPGEDAGSVARAISRDLGRVLGDPVTVGGAGPARGLDGLAAAFRDADRVLSVLLRLGRDGDGAGAAELGFVGLLLGDERDVGGFLDRTLGPLLDYDSRRGTTLVQTLEAYFGSGGGLARAAELLHVHVNTVTQRLDRIGQLLGGDWQKPDRALEIQLALRLHRLRTAIGS